jgi:CRP-like cAMP-binding protein
MADYLGLTIETVSRTLTRLKRDELIALPTPQEVILQRLRDLAALANGDLAE